MAYLYHRKLLSNKKAPKIDTYNDQMNLQKTMLGLKKQFQKATHSLSLFMKHSLNGKLHKQNSFTDTSG